MDNGALVSRDEAKTAGRRFYFTGNPCKHGHVCERKTVNGSCVECARDQLARFEIENRDRRKARRRELATARSDEIRAHKKAWRDANRDRVRETDRVRGARHKEKVKARASEWQRANPDKVRAREARRRSRIVGAGTYTPDDVARIMNDQGGRCAYCRVDVVSDYHVDHIMPLARGGTNTSDNIQICCPTCNIKKGWADPDQFLARFKAEAINADH